MSDAAQLALIAIIPSSLAALLSAWVAIQQIKLARAQQENTDITKKVDENQKANADVIKKLETNTDGIKEALLKKTEDAGVATGKLAGIAEERAKTDK